MSKQSKFQYLIYSLLLALLIGGLIMWATGSNPFAVYAAVLTGSFGSLSGLMSVLAYTTPLILTGLGAVVAFQGGVFNIGGEGQLLVGGLAAVLTGIYVDLPQPLPLLLALIAGFAAGALWALIPTLMQITNCARRKSSQVAFGQGFDSPQLHHKKRRPMGGAFYGGAEGYEKH